MSFNGCQSSCCFIKIGAVALGDQKCQISGKILVHWKVTIISLCRKCQSNCLLSLNFVWSMKVLMDFMTLNKQRRAISSPNKKLASSKGSPTFCWCALFVGEPQVLLSLVLVLPLFVFSKLSFKTFYDFNVTSKFYCRRKSSEYLNLPKFQFVKSWKIKWHVPKFTKNR